MANKEMIEITILATVVFCLVILGIMLFIIFMFNKKRFIEKSNYVIELKNKELEMMAAVVQAQEQERAKIARNLHDEVGAILTMATRNLKGTLKQISKAQNYYEDVIFTIEILEQSTDKIRSISHGMLPHFLLKFGLEKTLQRLAEQTQKTLGNPCTFNSKITDELKLNQHYLIHFYSIILELLNNLLKHSHPHSVQFELEKSQTHLFLNIKHDGVAINQSDYEYLLNHSDGMGLESISLRLKLINGELLYQRYSPGGTIQLAMPLTETNLSDEKINL
jgi:two-component system NarL family sensor kinase